jgi:hypothetical protein
MAIRKMRFSFEVDMATLVQVLAQANSGVKVDVYGDDKPPKGLHHIKQHEPKLLEAPKKHRVDGQRKPRENGRPTVYATLLAFLVAHKDRAVGTNELKPIIVAIGAAPNSVSPQVHKLRQDGFIKPHGDGYQVTARGLAHHVKTTTVATQAEG